MKSRFYSFFMMSVIFTVFCSPSVTVFANQSNSLNSSATSTDFSHYLKSRIQNLVADAINDTDNIINSINSTTLLSNGSNLSSSNIITSKSIVTSTVNSNDSDSGSSSFIKDQVTTINGVCNLN